MAGGTSSSSQHSPSIPPDRRARTHARRPYRHCTPASCDHMFLRRACRVSTPHLFVFYIRTSGRQLQHLSFMPVGDPRLPEYVSCALVSFSFVTSRLCPTSPHTYVRALSVAFKSSNTVRCTYTVFTLSLTTATLSSLARRKIWSPLLVASFSVPRCLSDRSWC
ncbi:hypothetical protein BC628DRAFT_811756 [Trametes gibbosa]|nr:hypothetical protein BC628DRAFT_811756 [Trametes gibbosa]